MVKLLIPVLTESSRQHLIRFRLLIAHCHHSLFHFVFSNAVDDPPWPERPVAKHSVPGGPRVCNTVSALRLSFRSRKGR